MRNVFQCAAAAVALTLVGPSVVAAQRPQTRAGWWLSAGTGVAVRGYGCRGCDTLSTQPRGLGPTLRLRLGGTFTSQLLLAMQVDVWLKSASGVSSFAGLLSPAFYYYPSDTGSFFFGFGFGHLGYAGKDGSDNVISNGLGLIVGVGRDYRIGPNVSFTPVVNLILGGLGALNANDVLQGRNYNQTMLEVGVGITLH